MNRKNAIIQRGDTIIEVLISMAILGLVLTTAFAISNRSYAVGLSAQERTEALKIADSQLELLRQASNISGSNVLETVTAPDRLFCIQTTPTNISRITYPFTGSLTDTNLFTDPIFYPNECRFGSDSRYGVSIDKSGGLGEIYSVRVRWESILGGRIEEVNHEYRTYDFNDTFSLPVNYGGPGP